MSKIKIGEIWSDLDPRFIQDSQGQLKKIINIDSVMGSIDNILRTNKGERLMLPQFGSSLRGVVFENMNSDALQFMSDKIQRDLEAWDDRIKITEITVYKDPDNNQVSVGIQFQIRGYEKVFQYTTPISGSEGDV
jgi:phage baseplate assembly protein W